MKTIFKAENLLLVIAGLFYLVSFFVAKKTLDINFHDTYYIIGFKGLLWLIALLFFIFFLLIKIIQKVTSK